jgi:hypothetical protein
MLGIEHLAGAQHDEATCHHPAPRHPRRSPARPYGATSPSHTEVMALAEQSAPMTSQLAATRTPGVRVA